MTRPRHSPLRHPVRVAAAPLRRRRPQHPRPAACRRTRHGPRRRRRRTTRGSGVRLLTRFAARNAGGARTRRAESQRRAVQRAGNASAGARSGQRPGAANAAAGNPLMPLSPMRARRGLPRPRQRALGSCASHWLPPRPRGRVVVACGEATMAGRPRLTRRHWLTSPRRVTEADRPGASGWRCPEERARRAHSWSGLALPAWRRVGSPVSPARPSTFSSPSLIVSSGLDSSADGS